MDIEGKGDLMMYNIVVTPSTERGLPYILRSWDIDSAKANAEGLHANLCAYFMEYEGSMVVSFEDQQDAEEVAEWLRTRSSQYEGKRPCYNVMLENHARIIVRHG